MRRRRVWVAVASAGIGLGLAGGAIAQPAPASFWLWHRNTLVTPPHVAEGRHPADDAMTLALRGRSERLPVARHFQRLFPGR